MSRSPVSLVCVVIKASEEFSAVTSAFAVETIVAASVDTVAAGVSVTGPPVDDTVITKPGKSARSWKVFEVDVAVVATPSLV